MKYVVVAIDKPETKTGYGGVRGVVVSTHGGINAARKKCDGDNVVVRPMGRKQELTPGMVVDVASSVEGVVVVPNREVER